MNAVSASVAQAWPPFVLVTGLLLIGRVAASDALFESIGALLSRLPGGTRSLFFSMMALVAVVSVLLNLDTAIVFVTPIVLHAARRREVNDRPFLYGTIFMSNCASLLLPGSNLTNLLVVSATKVNGARYAAAMLPAWAAAVALSALVVAIWCSRELGEREVVGEERVRLRLGFGAVGIAGATAVVLVDSEPALPVLAIAIMLVFAQWFTPRRVDIRAAFRSVNAEILASLFVVAVVFGFIARSWRGPRDLLQHLGFLSTAALGAGASNLVNNLPATMLLSAQPPPHPQALLIGLDLGPNLTVFGAMSSLLWLRVSRANGSSPSAATFTRIGLVLVPITIVVATLVSQYLVIGNF